MCVVGLYTHAYVCVTAFHRGEKSNDDDNDDDDNDNGDEDEDCDDGDPRRVR